jgi:hypothetical protein
MRVFNKRECPACDRQREAINYWILLFNYAREPLNSFSKCRMPKPSTAWVFTNIFYHYAQDRGLRYEFSGVMPKPFVHPKLGD